MSASNHLRFVYVCVWLFFKLLAGNLTTVLLKQPAGICYTERRTVHLSICHQVLNKHISAEIHARNIYIYIYIERERDTHTHKLSWENDLAAGICFSSAMRALVKSNSDDGWSPPAHSLHSSSSQRWWMGLRSDFCAEQSVHTKLGHLFLYGPGVVHGGFVILKQERNVHKQCWTGWTLLSNISLLDFV